MRHDEVEGDDGTDDDDDDEHREPGSFQGGLTRSARRGSLHRIDMPANTGNVAISNIVHHNLPDAKDAASGPMNRWKAMLTMMGTVTMLRMLLTAVKLTESGTSPNAILVQRFEVQSTRACGEDHDANSE